MIDEKGLEAARQAIRDKSTGGICYQDRLRCCVENNFSSRSCVCEGLAPLALTAYLAAVPTTKEGWKMVPVEPTREMWAAMGDAIVGYKQRHHDKVAEQIWTAALNAAPPPPEPKP